jgi:uncharacterized membrane protein YbhN (UPF0104 family)
VERPLPNLRHRFRRGQEEVKGEGVLDGLLVADATEGWAFLGIAIAVGIVILVLLPLLGIALELIALLLVLLYGLFGRVVLRRPWIVEAVDIEDVEERAAFAVKGWRDSSAALRELRGAIASAGPPARLSVGRPLATKPAGRRA